MRTKKFTLLMVLVAAVLFAIPAQAFLWNWAEQETPSYFGQKENLHIHALSQKHVCGTCSSMNTSLITVV